MVAMVQELITSLSHLLTGRQNDLQLQEKERREKELVNQIREEAEDYKIDFLRRSEINCETNKANNREKEKVSGLNVVKNTISTKCWNQKSE